MYLKCIPADGVKNRRQGSESETLTAVFTPPAVNKVKFSSCIFKYIVP